MNQPPSKLSTQIQAVFKRLPNNPLPPRILVAVSGGADSVALLLALNPTNAEIAVAHIDHGTRNGKSTKDALWVETLAEKLHLPFYSKRVDVPALASASIESFEQVARRTRYDFLADTADKHNFDAIATGHHKDDQAETILMRILRGTSTTGLAGIPLVGEWNGVPIIRPLLNTSRAEILEYLQYSDTPYLDDESNTDPKFLRNRLRHNLLPQLRSEFNPQLDDALVQLADHASTENNFLQSNTLLALQQCVVQPHTISRASFRKLHPSIQRRVVLDLALKANAAPDFAIITGAVAFIVEGNSGARYDLTNDVVLSNGRDETLLVPQSSTAVPQIEIQIPGIASFDQHTFRFSELSPLPEAPIQSFCSPSRQLVDADAFGNAAVLRHRKSGDRIKPLGMHGTRKLKDYFGDIGIPIETRDRIPLVARGSDIVWIVGYAVSDSYAIRDTTKRGLLIEVLHDA